MKTKQKRSKLTMFARITLGLLTLFLCAVAISTDVSLSTAITSVTLAVAPFAFTVPTELKEKMNEEAVKSLEDLGKKLGEYVKQHMDGNLDQKGLNEVIKKSWDEHFKEFGITKESYKSLQDTLKQQGIEITTLKEAQSNGGTKGKDLKEQIKEWVGQPDFNTALKERRTLSLELKAAVPMSAYVESAGSVANLNPVFAAAPELFTIEVDRTINSAPRETPFLWNLVSKGSSDAAVIIWFNRKNIQGGATFIPEYGVKQLMSWEYEKETTSPFKIAVGVKVSEEMMIDASFITSEIQRVTKDELLEKIDGRVLKHITDNASAYQGTPLDGTVETPNNADAIRAALLQLRNANYKADTLVITPTTRAMLDLTKSSTGNYLKQELDALLRGLNIYETTELADPDDFLLFDSSKIIAKNKGGLRVSTGWGVNKVSEADGDYKSDFEMNAVTMLVERYMFLYQDSLHYVGMIKDKFSVVKEALVKEA